MRWVAVIGLRSKCCVDMHLPAVNTVSPAALARLFFCKGPINPLNTQHSALSLTHPHAALDTTSPHLTLASSARFAFAAFSWLLSSSISSCCAARRPASAARSP